MCGIFVQDLPYVEGRRIIISDTKFPIGIRLPQNGLDGFSEPPGVNIVNGHQYRYPRLGAKSFDDIGDRCLFLVCQDVIFCEPILVGPIASVTVDPAAKRIAKASNSVGFEELLRLPELSKHSRNQDS